MTVKKYILTKYNFLFLIANEITFSLHNNLKFTRKYDINMNVTSEAQILILQW